MRRKIQISDFRFIKRDLNWLNYFLEAINFHNNFKHTQKIKNK